MDLTARRLVAAVILLPMLAASPAAAQLGDEIPGATYYVATQAIYAGEYREAERALRREAQRGVRAGQTRWIDAICHHAMLGEVLYQQGRNGEALANFDQACQMLLAYPDWLLQVEFQPQPLRPDLSRARRVPTWGQPERQFVIGQFNAAEKVAIGELNSAELALRQGGVVRQAMYWRVNVVEVIRASALAIRRRNEILGPLAQYDPISKELSDVLSGGNLSRANHWSGAWIDLLRGLSRSGMGKLDEADMLLGRSLVVDGQFDHPLTCVAFMEQGRVALARGDSQRAGKLFAEAGYSAFYFENWDVLTESILLGWLNHITSNSAGIYPPLEPVAAWAGVNRLQHVAVKLRLAQAESLLWLGETDAAAAILDDVSRRMGEMRTGLSGVQMLYVQAATLLTRGKLESGNSLLLQALAAQTKVSLRNFQIDRTNDMYDSRVVAPRVAVDLYASLLADPTPPEWVLQPLDAMAVLSAAHDASFDRWFIAALERKETATALEIAEKAKRRRFLAAQPLGGRIDALRSILESPQGELTRDGLMQRQQLEALFPAYKNLADVGRATYDQLRAGPLIATNPAETKSVSALFDQWEANARQRQLLLSQFAPRRLATSIQFPPILTSQDLQKSLAKGEALVVFHSVAGSLYGFLVTDKDAVLWQLRDLRRLRSDISDLLQELGNFGPARQLSVTELQGDKWREPAANAFARIFADARLDLDKTTSLVIVPDDVLWYLPFETLVPDPKQETVLADRVLIRYGPTAALAVSNSRPLRRPQRTGIVATQNTGDADAMPSAEMLEELEKLVAAPVRLPSPLPVPPSLVSPLLDALISFDDIEQSAPTTQRGLPLSKSRGAGDDALNAWFGLPHGGPERVVLSGFTTAAEQGLKPSSRRGGAQRKGRPGDELFHQLCSMMSDGARTILLTRWRTGGRTNFELVCEFVRELPDGPANEAWQRACLLAREAPLEASLEPRLKRADITGELPTADHPFFWAGYLLADTSPRAESAEAAAEPLTDKPTDKKEKTRPPAEKKPLPAADDTERTSAGEASKTKPSDAAEDKEAATSPATQ
jgi:hypothetical protein